LQVLYDSVPVEEEGPNLLLYLGLGLVAIGLIITFVGLGEKGFRTVELKLVGPVLVVGGVALVFVRIMLCKVGTSRDKRCAHLLDDKQDVFEREKRNRVFSSNGDDFKEEVNSKF
jgi:ABC-type proline/glycine betaine transport system permease subunit